MNTKQIILSLLVIGAVVASGSAAWALADGSAAGYGMCGDGILERMPNYDVPQLVQFQEQCDNGYQTNDVPNTPPNLVNKEDNGCYKKGLGLCKIRQDFAGNGIIEKYTIDGKEQWERCDDGHHSTSAYCDDKGKPYSIYDYYRSSGSVCGNGVIDQGESCDNGDVDTARLNHSEGACGTPNENDSSKCQYQGRDTDKKYYSKDGYECKPKKTLCGDGVVDKNAGEECDLGKQKNGQPGSGCSENCTLSSPEYSSPTFKRENFYFYNPKGLGGVMDYGGAASGSVPLNPIGSNLTEKQKEVEGSVYNPTTKKMENKKVLVYNILDRGRIVVVERNQQQQYSGIVPSGQMIDQGAHIHFLFHSADPNFVFDNDTIGLVFGMKKGQNPFEKASSPDYLMLRWRSEESGIYISGDTSDVTQTDPPHCNGPVWAGARGDKGLRLFHVKGVPTYNEFWKMQNCPGEDKITHIPTQIFQTKSAPDNIWNLYAYNSLGPDKNNYKPILGKSNYEHMKDFKPSYLPGDEEFITNNKSKFWNKMVNPAFTWNKTYESDLGIAPIDEQTLQIDAYYNVDEKGNPIKGLKVYVNYQKVMDVDATDFDWWPTKGEWGFYFLGMDNFVADFRSLENLVKEDPKYYPSLPSSDATGTRCNYCGDGITQPTEGKRIPHDSTSKGEGCDDGNDVAHDGCEPAEYTSDPCQITPGWECNTDAKPSQCFMGTIDYPTSEESFGLSRSPNKVSGSFKGLVEYVKLTLCHSELTDPSYPKDCQGNSNKRELNCSVDKVQKNWDCDFSASEPLDDNGKYLAEVVFGNGTAKQNKTVNFTIDHNKPNLSIVSPVEKYLNGKYFAFSFNISGGTSLSLSYDTSVVECDSTTNTSCQLGSKSKYTKRNLTESNNYSFPGLNDSSIAGVPAHVVPVTNGKYKYVFNLKNSVGNESGNVEKEIVIDSIPPGLKTLHSLDGGVPNLLTPGASHIVASKNGKLELSGNIDVCNFSGSDFIQCPQAITKDLVAPVKPIKIFLGGESYDKNAADNAIEVPVSRNGDFLASVPVPSNLQKRTYLWICGSDEAGNALSTREIPGEVNVDATNPCCKISNMDVVDINRKISVAIQPKNGGNITPDNNKDIPFTVTVVPKNSSSIKVATNLSGEKGSYLAVKGCAKVASECKASDWKYLHCTYNTNTGECTGIIHTSSSDEEYTIKADYKLDLGGNSKDSQDISTFHIETRTTSDIDSIKNNSKIEVLGAEGTSPETLDLTKNKDIQVKVTIPNAKIGDKIDVVYSDQVSAGTYTEERTLDLGSCTITAIVPASGLGSCTTKPYDTVKHSNPGYILPSSGKVKASVSLKGDGLNSVDIQNTVDLNIIPNVSITSPHDGVSINNNGGIPVSIDSQDCSGTCSPVVWFCESDMSKDCLPEKNNTIEKDGNGQYLIPSNKLEPAKKYTVVAGAKVTGNPSTYIPRDAITVTYAGGNVCSNPQPVGHTCVEQSNPINIHLDGGDPKREIKIVVEDSDHRRLTICPNNGNKCYLTDDGKYDKAISDPRSDNNEPMTGPFTIISEMGPCEVGQQCTVKDTDSSGKIKVDIKGTVNKPVHVTIVSKDNPSAGVIDVCSTDPDSHLCDNTTGTVSINQDPTTSAGGHLDPPYSVVSCYVTDLQNGKCPNDHSSNPGGGTPGGGNPGTNPSTGNGATVDCDIKTSPSNDGVTTCTGGQGDADKDFPLTINVTNGTHNAPYKITVTDAEGHTKTICDASDINNGACRTNGTGSLTKTIDSADKAPLTKGPFTVNVNEIPTCDADKTLQTCEASDKDGKVVVNVNGSPGAKVHVTIVDGNGKSVNVCDGPCTIGKGGTYDSDNPGVSVKGLEGPYKVTVTPYDLGDSTNGSGLISGGCACSSAATPTDSILSVLLAALGLLFLRRRTQEDDDELAA